MSLDRCQQPDQVLSLAAIVRDAMRDNAAAQYVVRILECGLERCLTKYL